MRAIDVVGWMDPPELDWLRAQASQHQVVVECGAWQGRSTLALAEGMANGTGTVFTIEHFQGSPSEREFGHKIVTTPEGREQIRNAFLANTRAWRDAGRLFLVEASSAEGLALLKTVLAGRGADMVFIDADHDGPAVHSDIEHGWALLRDGGLLCGHDYADPIWPGVTEAVDELLPGRVRRGPGSLWYCTKNGSRLPVHALTQRRTPTASIDELLRLYVAYHDPATLGLVKHRDYMTLVDLHALPLGELQDNRLAEARFFLADITPDRPYVGMCSPRWPLKWPKVVRPDRLDGLAKYLRPGVVYAPLVHAYDTVLSRLDPFLDVHDVVDHQKRSTADHNFHIHYWPETGDRDHPGMWRRLLEMYEMTGRWPNKRAILASNTLICSVELFLEFRTFFRQMVRHFQDRYGFDQGYGVHPAGLPRTVAYFYERLACLYFSTRLDVALCHLPDEDRLQAPLDPSAYILEHRMGETAKAHTRRLREGWFDRYVRLDRPGIDIGSGPDPLNAVFRRYDRADGDAQYMANVPSNSFWTVYASHVLEHVWDPGVTLENWYRLLVPGGYLLLSVPHRDLYERKLEPPSRWNDEHKTFWLPEHHELPHTRGLRQTIREACPAAEIVELRVCDEGYHDPGATLHAHGEFSIEAVLRRPGA